MFFYFAREQHYSVAAAVGLLTLILYLSRPAAAPPQPSLGRAPPPRRAPPASPARAPPASPPRAPLQPVAPRGLKPAPSSPARRAGGPPAPSPRAAGAPPARLSVFAYALLIIPLNLVWAYAQELVGATAYGSCASPKDANCERFRSIPVMNLLQALLASAVASACIWWRGAAFKRAGPMLDMLPAALCHTVASPVGYLAMRFIPYPLYILVSSCKLIPVLLVGVLVNRGIARGAHDFFSALIMTQGVLLYSGAKALEAGGGGGAAAAARFSRVGSFLGLPLSEGAAVAVGVGLTVTNLVMEGFTNAWQDRLNKRLRDAGRAGIPALQMMLDMNFLNFAALAVGLGVECACPAPRVPPPPHTHTRTHHLSHASARTHPPTHPPPPKQTRTVAARLT
jgi:hypothetical protein